MNKSFKAFLFLQIPNILILVSLLITFLVGSIPYFIDFIFNNSKLIFWIVLGSIYTLINIFSFIFLIIGILNEVEKYGLV